jgi:predicted helicase
MSVSLKCLAFSRDESSFSALMVSQVTDFNLAPGKGGYHCFPLYLYDEAEVTPSGGLFDEQATAPAGLTRRDAITDQGLAHFAAAYPSETLAKEDVFYYVYGLLHSPEYLERYADNLSKELPRIPCVKTVTDFWAFSKAGRQLADLHLNYETVTPYPKT